MFSIACLLLSAPVAALSSSTEAPIESPQSETFEIDGFRFLSERPVAPAVRHSLEAQVRIVSQLNVSPRVIAFFKSLPLRLGDSLNQAGVSGPEGVVLRAEVVPSDNPVLLHEVLHVYHFRELPGGIANQVVEQAYTTALSTGPWPQQSYMLSNKREFFAMTASAVLHGRVARPPFTRSAMKKLMPAYYRWILEEFDRP